MHRAVINGAGNAPPVGQKRHGAKRSIGNGVSKLTLTLRYTPNRRDAVAGSSDDRITIAIEMSARYRLGYEDAQPPVIERRVPE